ncbi:hypothetical protein C7S20_19445 [Christiangramia fulva]|uniref:Uncharacterized protein n=1 Tax=Christiangramia fulva TaxID=2126553 RepID=A0A2R3ZAH0_9FLAO|nr:hypothetical protein [Christiangramia fulva]AVR47251.1 hypothetical protein C7S20_19445 [Christiangramia fulva]
MAKKTNSKDTVKIKRGAQEKTISKAQWDLMKKEKATYGWMLASEVPDDVKTVEQQMELSQVQDLTKKLEAANSEKAELQKTVEAQEATIEDLTKKLEAANTADSKGADDKAPAKKADSGKK